MAWRPAQCARRGPADRAHHTQTRGRGWPGAGHLAALPVLAAARPSSSGEPAQRQADRADSQWSCAPVPFAAPRRHWAPTTWAVLPDEVQPVLGAKRCGIVSFMLAPGTPAQPRLVEPAGIAQLTIIRDIPDPYHRLPGRA